MGARVYARSCGWSQSPLGLDFGTLGLWTWAWQFIDERCWAFVLVGSVRSSRTVDLRPFFPSIISWLKYSLNLHRSVLDLPQWSVSFLSALSAQDSRSLKKFVLLYFKHQRWSKLKSENVPLLTITVLILSLKVTHQPESRYPATRIIISLVDRNVSKYTYILNHKLQHIVSVESGIVDIVSDTSSFSYYWRRVQSCSSSYDTVEIILKVLLLKGGLWCQYKRMGHGRSLMTWMSFSPGGFGL